jgi:hypothetical protein
MTEKAERSTNTDELIVFAKEITRWDEKLPAHPDMVYLVGQTKGNQEEVLAVAREFPGVPVGFIGHDGTESSGFPGGSAWRKELQRKDPHRLFDPSSLVPILGSFTVGADGVLRGHTRTEMQALVDHAIGAKLKKIIIVAPRFHMPRAYMTAVTVLLEKKHPEISIYAKNADDLPWLEKTVHSQGSEAGRRIDFIKTEAERIEKYQKLGHLASLEEVEAYRKEVERRDAEQE